MRKLMIVASFVLVAMAANAQGRYDNRDYRRGGYDNDHNRYGRNERYDDRFDPNGRIDSYQREARKRIAWGIENGSITAHEAKRLLKEAERIEFKENAFLRDRFLDNRERKELAQDLADLNRQITRESRDWNRQPNDDYRRGGRYAGRY